MTSEIRSSTLKNRVGLGTVSFTNTGPVVSGIVTANSFSGPLITTSIDLNGDLDVDGHTNLDNVSVVGMVTFSGNIDLGGAVNCTNNVTISGTAPVLNFIDTNQNPDFSIQNDAGQLKFKNTTSNQELAVFTATGLYSDNINVTGDLDVDGHTNLDNVSIAGITTFSGQGIRIENATNPFIHLKDLSLIHI